MNITEFLARLTWVKKCGDGWQARCPAHDDRKASLTVTEGDKQPIVVKCHAGCSTESIVAALGLKVSELSNPKPKINSYIKPRIVAAYPYHDETGKVLFETVRYEPKDFKQRRPDPTRSGKWIWNLKGVRRVLNRLPELKAAITAGQTIYIVAGEKDVGAMVQHGLAATCNPLGEKKDGNSWLPEYTETLRGAAKVVVIADKDETGRAHARVVATALCPVVSSLKLVELPDANGKLVKDAADFLAAGGTAEELRGLVDSAPEFVPTPEPLAAKLDSPASEYIGSDDGLEPDAESGARDGQKPRKSAATRLVELAQGFVFFHDPQNRAFVRLQVTNHVEVWAVNSSQFRNLLAKIFWKKMRKAINRNALADAVAILAGIACHDSPEEPVFLRVAPHGESILIDLCDPQWRVVEVTPDGWRVLDKSPVPFIRTGAMRPLPLPVPAEQGSLNPLWELLNVTPAQRPLVVGALLNYFHPGGPYFVTNFIGEQGTAKSCAAKIVRMLVDPSEIPLRSPPREERDLLVQAANNWCVALDNLSGLQPWLSDGLCRLATGGGHSARQLYTDGEEFSLSVKRPVIMNGIDDAASRPDLAERALQIELETILDEHRISERRLWQKFEDARPVIFSALLNGLACALRNLPKLELNGLPRMADPTQWATAGETTFGWQQGTFLTAYLTNLTEGAIASVEAHPVGIAIRQLLDGTPEWLGEPRQLLDALNGVASKELTEARNWPKNPRSLSSCLRRLAQALRRSGINLEFARSKRRQIRLCKTGIFASQSSQNQTNDAKLPLLHGEKPLVEELV
jgi:hypothetical protein